MAFAPTGAFPPQTYQHPFRFVTPPSAFPPQSFASSSDPVHRTPERPKEYKEITMNGVKLRVETLPFSSGEFKNAYWADVLSGPHAGKKAIMLEQRQGGDGYVEWDVATVFAAQQAGAKTGYVVEPVTYQEGVPGNPYKDPNAKSGYLVTLPAPGEKYNCFDFDMSLKRQLTIATAYFELAKQGVYQTDGNCWNLFWDGDKLTIIDDLTFRNDTGLNRLYQVMSYLSNLQWTSSSDYHSKFPVFQYARQFMNEYNVRQGRIMIQNPAKTSFTPLVAKDPSLQPVYDQLNAMAADLLSKGGRSKKRRATRKNKKRTNRRSRVSRRR